MTTESHRYHDDDRPLAPVIPLFGHRTHGDYDEFDDDDDQGLILRFTDDYAVGPDGRGAS